VFPAGEGTAARRNPSLKREVRHATPCATDCTVRTAEEVAMRGCVAAAGASGSFFRNGIRLCGQ